MKNKGRRGKRGKNRKVLYAAGGCVAVLLLLVLLCFAEKTKQSWVQQRTRTRGVE